MSTQKVAPANNMEPFQILEIKSKGNVKNKPKFTGYLLYCIIVCVYGGTFQFGWNVSVFNIPVQKMFAFYNQTYLNRYGVNIPEDTLTLLWSITNGIVPFGGIFGGLFSGFVADLLGRKFGMLSVNLIVIISGILCIISKFVGSYEVLIVGRFFAGLVSGLFTGICSLYVSEIAPTNLRGLASTMNPLALTSGILLANILGLPEIFGTDKLWPLLVGLMLVPVLIHIGLFFAVESPKYLYINKGQIEEAEKALIKLRGNIDLAKEELNELALEKETLSKEAKTRYVDLVKKKPLRRALIVTLFLQISQQLIGADAMIFYSTEIFLNADLGESWSNYGTIILGVLQVVMTILCLFTIEIAGRRVLLLIGTVGVSLSCFSLSIFRIFAPQVEWFKYMTIVSAVTFTIFFNLGPGSVAFMIATELFESSMRGKATSLAIFLNWSCIFLLAVTYPLIEQAINVYSFLIFGVDSLIFAIIIYLILPETKNRPIEEIKNHFENSSNIFFKLSRAKNVEQTEYRF